MAIKALMLKKKIDVKRSELDALLKTSEELEQREAELTQAIEEAETEEERSAVEEAVEQFEADKADCEEKKGALEQEISGLENELAEEERSQGPVLPATEPEERKAEPAKTPVKREHKMEVGNTMAYKTALARMGVQEREAFVQRDDMQKFIGEIRALMNKRDAGGVNNASILIPEVALPYLREIAEENSKMLKHVNYQRVPGTGRMVIDGGFAEAVWTEMCATLNELTIGFNDLEIDGYKVGGYIKVCNALLEDSDIALADDILTKIGRGIGYALDKAILYGTGTKMPLGILPRLAQTQAPADYPATARTWVDLHSTNITTISAANSTGIKLFQNIVTATGAMSNKFANGPKWFAMNEATKTKLVIESMEFNANGAIVAGVGETMPVVGGAIEVLDFIPNNVIICGYDGLYLLAERAGTQLAQSEHRFFIEDQTVFRGTARYDGKPAIAEGFIALGISGTTPAANAVTFAQDTANVQTPATPAG